MKSWFAKGSAFLLRLFLGSMINKQSRTFVSGYALQSFLLKGSKKYFRFYPGYAQHFVFTILYNTHHYILIEATEISLFYDKIIIDESLKILIQDKIISK